jgi:hypothetical protein
MDYAINRIDDGTVAANDPDGALLPMVVIGDGARIFHRRGMKLYPDGTRGTVSWLVGELDGVRAYFDGASIVLSKQDLYP